MAYLLSTCSDDAGNAAVAGIIAGTGGRVPARRPGLAAVVIQRMPARSVSRPAGDQQNFAETAAVTWWRKYPGTTLANFAVILLEEASASLEKIGVPAVERDAASSTSARGWLPRQYVDDQCV